MRAYVLLYVAAVPCAAFAQSSFTDARDHRPSDDFAISACGDAAAREVRARSPMASQVQVDDARPSPTSDTRTDVSGTGHLRDGAGVIRHFTFRCGYDLRAGRTSEVSVSL